MAICDQIQETLEGHVVTLEKIDSGNWDILVKTRDQELCQLKDNKLNRSFNIFSPWSIQVSNHKCPAQRIKMIVIALEDENIKASKW